MGGNGWFGGWGGAWGNMLGVLLGLGEGENWGEIIPVCNLFCTLFVGDFVYLYLLWLVVIPYYTSLGGGGVRVWMMVWSCCWSWWMDWMDCRSSLWRASFSFICCDMIEMRESAHWGMGVVCRGAVGSLTVDG